MTSCYRLDSFPGEFDEEDDDEEEESLTLIKSRSEASSPWGHDRNPNVEDDDETDSDAEFAVHPILRSLIKSKSAYTIPSENKNFEEKKGFSSGMKNSKTSFEMSLSKVLNSASRSIIAENEPVVANFVSKLDQKWPEPEEDSPVVSRKRSKNALPKMSGCWSSPPNVFVDDVISVSSFDSGQCQTSCWSAPEYGVDEDEENEEDDERDVKTLDDDDGSLLRMEGYSQSYPAIDTPEPVSSLCSIRLPSSRGSVLSPSPPRPLSPVLGKPGRMSASRSCHLRPRPDIEELFDDSSDDIDDDEWPQKEPWPQQEVWPEPDMIQGVMVNSWVSNELPRSTSVQLNVVSTQHARLPNSRSAHSNLVPSVHSCSSASSSTQMLDDEESFELARRNAWVERGSLVQLSGDASSAHEWPRYQNGPSIRRSYTTEEFKRTRRRLPRRPDDVAYRPGELPCSMSMYDRSFYDERDEYPEYADEGVNKRIQPVVESIPSPTTTTIPRPPSTLNIHPNINCRSRDLYSEYETPMSPPKHLLPSPHSTGRRLPALPLNSTILARLPSAMSAPPPPPPQKSDHTLCFIEGMTDSVMQRSAFEDSYYEDDTINGNSYRRPQKSFFSPDDSSGVSSCTTSDSINPTHRVQSTFIPRHHDEVQLDIGDAVHVERTYDDHWCYGTNLRTGQPGIFPSSVVCEIDIVEEICLGALPTNTSKVMNSERDTFYLTMLASIEVAHHKGNDILVQAMNKVLSMYKNREEVIVPQTVLMEISFRGIHVIDKRRKNFFQCPTFDFFYSLQNISFCGAHPKQLKYFGFITKHPLLPRFACHVFMSSSSTQPIVESIGRAFKRSYDEYMAFAHPTEDIYLE